jgi:hypothetical protein
MPLTAFFRKPGHRLRPTRDDRANACSFKVRPEHSRRFVRNLVVIVIFLDVAGEEAVNQVQGRPQVAVAARSKDRIISWIGDCEPGPSSEGTANRTFRNRLWAA